MKTSKNLAKLPLRKVLSVVLLAFITAFFISSAFVALPLTERINKAAGFDLIIKDNVYEKEYLLDVRIPRNKADRADEYVNKTKNVLFNRLRKINTEKILIKESENSKEGDENYFYRRLNVKVRTNVIEDQLDALVTSRSNLVLVVPKEGFNPNTAQNQIDQFLASNYVSTDFNRATFRNVYIKKLPTQGGTEAYFAVFKVWPHKSSEFDNFMDEYAGQIIGVKVDDFVTPVTVPLAYDKSLAGTQTGGKVFSVTVASTPEQAKIADILYNSGFIPQSYEVSSQSRTNIERINVNYTNVFLATLAGLALVFIYIYYRNERSLGKVVSFAALSIVTVSTWIAALKLLKVEVDPELLMLEVLSILILIKLASYRSYNFFKIEIMSLLLLVIAYLFGFSRMSQFAYEMLFLILLYALLRPLIEIYLSNMKRFLVR